MAVYQHYSREPPSDAFAVAVTMASLFPGVVGDGARINNERKSKSPQPSARRCRR
jgi:hypothetical protein